ncbi:MAG: DUF2126 domain-containing protein [Lacipirellulaceae bacterium]
MSIRVALHHDTIYRYDRRVQLGAQTVRLRPAAHCRTPVRAYSLTVNPGDHFCNWQQDPFGNFLARLVFHSPTTEFRVSVDLVAELASINPFDFFVEEQAETFPFTYSDEQRKELAAYLEPLPDLPLVDEYLRTVNTTRRRTIDFLVDLNRQVQNDIGYLIRLEPGVQSPDETLAKRSGSCRDSAWLLVQVLRRLGIAARFVSGYLIQLAADQESLDGPSGPENDFTDLHAWTEAFLPGAGWVGVDPTSGLFAGEGHLPLAATPSPQSAAPISGGLGPCETEFDFAMTVTRIHESPRVTKPYTEAQWAEVDALGQQVDERLRAADVRLTMGGEPTFVSIDDMDGPEWNTAAVGPDKQDKSDELIRRLKDRFAPSGLLHFGQGKWYPGESLPRWSYSCLWRADGQPIWRNDVLLADVAVPGSATAPHAAEFVSELCDRLGVSDEHVRAAYENPLDPVTAEARLPLGVDPDEHDLESPEERRRLARTLARGIRTPVGYILPIGKAWGVGGLGWATGPWPTRSERLLLIPGDSPIGLRLPLECLPPSIAAVDPGMAYAVDPSVAFAPLPDYETLLPASLRGRDGDGLSEARTVSQVRRAERGGGTVVAERIVQRERSRLAPASLPPYVLRTALCVEPRDGRMHVFMPPTSTLEDYLELLATVEETAESLDQAVVIEGYLPPPDPRVRSIKVTPDPGVLEVNVQPASSWDELKEITTAIYDEARLTRLGTEKFQLDGRHSGTGGGNHVVLGGPTAADSPFLRRPDVLRSMIAYWNNHPSLSYLFSGLFVGPTSQSPRIDEGRRDALYELELALEQIPDAPHADAPLNGHAANGHHLNGSKPRSVPPWIVDRVLRHLLVDLTGNTHRAEFCIDKLYSPDSTSGRLGLVELRAFEMPPHSRMSLVQQLLVRSLVTMFWDRPYKHRLARWGTAIHDRFLLPLFLDRDLREVLDDLDEAGLKMPIDWFAPHFEFRFPHVGTVEHNGMALELRTAIEPWHVLGEEPGAGGTTRFVDSSVERMQVHVTGLTSDRYAVCCNGRRLPLQRTGVFGERVAGVRYRAWQPPSCLHPTIPVSAPLVFDLVDLASERSIGGCTYHVGHPGGVNSSNFPVNALEAESRRAARFSNLGHTTGPMTTRVADPHPDAPCTLDLRWPGA